MKKEIKIGIIGLIAVTLLILGINYLKGVKMFQPTHNYYVEFTDINGLATSSPVFANGYKVGIVRSISYNYKKLGHVIVEVEMEDEMTIPKGSQGELVTDMLGTVKMNLLLALENPTFCQPGDTLDGIVNKGIMGVAETMVPKVEVLLPKMDSILCSLNQLLANPSLAATLHHTEQITANLNITTSELNRLMKNEIPQITSNLNTLTNNMTHISHNLKKIDYAQTFQSIDSTLRNVRLLTEKLNSTDNTIGLFLNDPTLYHNLNTTSANAASLLDDLKSHPKRYVHFSIFGRK